MYDPDLRSAILRILSRWGRLPTTDLLVRLTPVQAAYLRRELFHDLAAEGLVEVREVGDERVVAITEQGRRALGDAGRPL